MKPISRLAVPFAAGILVAAAISFPVFSAQAPDNKVEIDNFAFSPERITVKTGTTVTWLNADDTPHTVASSSKLFKSKALDSLHPHMTGTVVVEGTTGSSAAQ